jgi:hypothetical protein
LRAEIEPLFYQEPVADRRVLALAYCFSTPLSPDHENREKDISMKKSVFQGARDAGTHMAAPSSASSTRVRPDRSSPPSTPRWVKVSAIIFIVLVLLFVLQHLAGGIFMGHMPGM